MEKGKRHQLQTALTYIQQGKLDRAIAEYEAILLTDPSDGNVLNALGDVCARTGKKTEAIGYFMRLAEAYRLDGLYVRAVAVFKKMLKLDPLHVEASVACGELYAEQGLIAEAKLQFQGLADYYLKRGDIGSAVEMYEKMIRMDPGHHSTLSKLAGILVRPGGVGEALAKLNALGVRLVEAGQAEDAQHIYQKGVELLKSQGREADAASFADGLNSLHPADAEARVEEALAAAFPGDGGHLDAAEIVMEQTMSLEILPGSSAEQEGVPDLESPKKIGVGFEEVILPPDEGLSEKGTVEAGDIHVAAGEMLDVDVSLGEEVKSVEEREPTAIELDLTAGSEEFVTLTEEPSAPVELVGSQTLEDELQEARFFLEQGMHQEAQAILQRILIRDPEQPVANQYMALIEQSVGTPQNNEELLPPDVKSPSVFRVTDVKTPQGEFVDLARELSAELSQVGAALAADLQPEVQQMLHQFDQGIRDQLDVTDYETHYNLGIAYKDLELHEKAIEEFRLAANDATYRVRCASLLGLCYLAKGDPERSVEELLKGLSATKTGTEERWGILYDLATAYEAFGDATKALETLRTIHSEVPKFRDVRVRVRDLRARLETGRGSSR
ncbi:MAG: tetratricopeptide repeat protein [candidate division NC10 bacterium]